MQLFRVYEVFRGHGFFDLALLVRYPHSFTTTVVVVVVVVPNI